MRDAQQQAAEKLSHALTFVRMAKETQFPELRGQHLNEAERLIEYVQGILEGEHGQAQAE